MKWCKQDQAWMIGLYGTAIGAGTLFLPINAGINGVLPLLVLTLLAFPMTFFSHRALCRFVLSGSNHQANIIGVVDEHFGHTASRLITFLYFFSIYPIVLLYSVAITNTVYTFIENQLQMTPPPRAILSILLILMFMAVVRVGHHAIIKAMNILVYPFIAILMILSIYLIPHWSMAIFTTTESIAHASLPKSLWLGIPVLIFSFNHCAMISQFAVRQRHDHGDRADEKCTKILGYSHLMMVVTVFFFVFSCVLSLTELDLIKAKAQNITILSYLANHFSSPFISYIAPLIAFIAISKSYLGHYIGACEGLQGLIEKRLQKQNKAIKESTLNHGINLFMLLSCWAIATVNPSILGMIQVLGGPVTAGLLFIMPMYGIKRIPAMAKYRSVVSDSFITIVGFVAISAIIYGFF